MPPGVCFELISQYHNVDRCSILRRQTAAIIKFKISSVERVQFGGPLNLAALCGRIARIIPKAGSEADDKLLESLLNNPGHMLYTDYCQIVDINSHTFAT